LQEAILVLVANVRIQMVVLHLAMLVPLVLDAPACAFGGLQVVVVVAKMF